MFPMSDGDFEPYLRSGQKIEWDSTFRKILGGPEQKTKFSETRQNLLKTESSAPLGRRAWGLDQFKFGHFVAKTLRGRFRNSGYF